MTIEEVLHLLADGRVHSGRELGEALGVSRTAVWKQLKKLEELGIRVRTVKGQGYQLENGLELLDEAAIRRAVSGRAAELLGQLRLHGSIDSTNSLALECARAGDAKGLVCLAEHQHAGRGRLGRPWVSPYGRNIYFSLVWEFNAGALALEGLSLAVGVAIVRALEASGVRGAQLKWPNDVLWRGKKLAGVLLEMTGDASGHCQVVVGIGLNVAMRPNEAEAVEQEWASIHGIDDQVSRNRLVAELLNALLPLLENYETAGFAPWRQAWEACDYFGRHEVEIRAGEQVIQGQVQGVTDTGALRLRTPRGEETIRGGEVSLRRPEE